MLFLAEEAIIIKRGLVAIETSEALIVPTLHFGWVERLFFCRFFASGKTRAAEELGFRAHGAPGLPASRARATVETVVARILLLF